MFQLYLQSGDGKCQNKLIYIYFLHSNQTYNLTPGKQILLPPVSIHDQTKIGYYYTNINVIEHTLEVYSPAKKTFPMCGAWSAGNSS